jgi:hypothetical protein
MKTLIIRRCFSPKAAKTGGQEYERFIFYINLVQKTV